jgi:hypothetical protein
MVAGAGLLALTAGCASSSSVAVKRPSSAQASISAAPTGSATPNTAGSQGRPGTQELVAGADFSTPEAAGYTVMKALGQVPLTSRDLTPYLNTAHIEPDTLKSELADLDKAVAMEKVKSVTAVHVLLSKPVIVDQYSATEADYSYSGNWCYLDGHCQTGDRNLEFFFRLEGGQWKLEVSDVQTLVSGPSS